jgi:hypothetical protein
MIKHHWYRFEDEQSPSQDAVEKSNNSIQPIDLDEDNKYEYDSKKNIIYDIKTRKKIEPKIIVQDIYNIHLKTLTDIGFKTKINIQKWLIIIINPLINSLKTINIVCFGKSFKKSENYFVGIWEVYKKDDMIDLTITSEKPKILGSDFPITYQTAITFVVVVLIIFLINYYYKYDLFGLVSLIKSANEISLFLASLVGVFLLIFDRVIPQFILFIINQLIKLKFRLTFLKISIH